MNYRRNNITKERMKKFAVVRCAVKDKATRIKTGGSKLPPRKEAVTSLKVTTDGCIGITKQEETADYNHYRTVSKTLKGTPDHAVSIMTMDVYRKLNELLPPDDKNQQVIEIGDFGENITLENIAYNEIEPGTILKVNDVVILENYTSMHTMFSAQHYKMVRKGWKHMVEKEKYTTI